MQDEIERWFEARGITYENGQLAVWLSKKHQNLEDIEQNNASQVAVIIKQAVATGWDYWPYPPDAGGEALRQ